MGAAMTFRTEKEALGTGTAADSEKMNVLHDQLPMIASEAQFEIGRPDVFGFRLDLHVCSGNALYRAAGRKVVISAEGRAFKKEMSDALAKMNVQHISGPVAVELEFHFCTRHRRDLDNYAKSMLDSLKGVCFDDDSDIYDLRLIKVIGAPCNCVYVAYWQLQSDPIPGIDQKRE